jgi:hypothetical protein
MKEMKIIVWDKDSVEDTSEALDNMKAVQDLVNGLVNDSVDFSSVATKDAIALVKANLMGEYHMILVRREEEYLEDSEVYVLTWDGEASDGGSMKKLDSLQLYKMAQGIFTKQDEEDC